ncbi:hypothetical protein [Acutalibacter muris]|uniref:hypothetical protein n=1 Tax=Acutalibacter muris TaxID=1796620 RepID=UPI001C3ECE4F|nr:hypothetical protein [Acutalibacter muris]
MEKSSLSKELRSELEKLPEMEKKVIEQQGAVWDVIAEHGADNDVHMLYEIAEHIPASYLRYNVFVRIYELDPEKQVEPVGKELPQDLAAEVHKYAELFQKQEDQVQRIEDLAAREGALEDAEKLSEAICRIPNTYLERIFWDRYDDLTHRFDSVREKKSETETSEAETEENDLLQIQ